MFGVLLWMLFGVIVGALAKLLMPGRDPGGVIVTMALGIAGSLIGGFVGRALGLYGPENNGAGFFMSIVGAILLLWLYRVLVVRRAGDAIETPWTPGRDAWWHDAVDGVSGAPIGGQVDPETPYMLIYT